MSAKQSNLSSAHFGYDFVVATSQASINAALKKYLFESDLPAITMYYNMDDNGSPVAVDYTALMVQTNNTDPFKVAEWDKSKPQNQDITNISNSSFWYAFQAKIGIPPVFDPGKIPDIITLNTGTESVTFNLMCSEFTVVETNFGRSGITSYLNKSQPSDGAWIFTSNVPLEKINDATNLPAPVQQQVDSMGGDFSVQKLFLDLDNAAFDSNPVISGVDSGTPLYLALNEVFLGAYFNAVKSKGETVLNYSITQNTADPSTLRLTAVDLYADAFIGSNGQPVINPTDEQKGLLTLNYLCASNGNQLPTPTQFSWNWLDDLTDEGNFDGVIAINRNTLANYFRYQLNGAVSRNCFLPYVKVTAEGLDPAFSWYLTGNQQPAVTLPPTGQTVLAYNYSGDASDVAGANGCLGQMELKPALNVSVDFTGKSIIITQHLVIYLRVQVYQTAADGNIVDQTITDTYTLEVDNQGKLLALLTTKSADNSQSPSVNGFLNFFTGINDLINSVKSWTKDFVSTAFTDIPVAVLQNFVFPGGKTFSFFDAGFSDNQDMVTHITYT